MLGHYEATAECGERCNRLVPARHCHNQLCEEHHDASLTCHLLRLPSEVRWVVFELVIRSGPVAVGDYRSQKYDIAMALLLANK
jgi:hypothetical protein